MQYQKLIFEEQAAKSSRQTRRKNTFVLWIVIGLIVGGFFYLGRDHEALFTKLSQAIKSIVMEHGPFIAQLGSLPEEKVDILPFTQKQVDASPLEELEEPKELEKLGESGESGESGELGQLGQLEQGFVQEQDSDYQKKAERVVANANIILDSFGKVIKQVEQANSGIVTTGLSDQHEQEHVQSVLSNANAVLGALEDLVIEISISNGIAVEQPLDGLVDGYVSGLL